MVNIDGNVGGFLSGFSEQYFPTAKANRQDYERQQLAERDMAMREQQAQQVQALREMQMQQAQAETMRQDQARKTAGLMATGQLGGDIGQYGRSPEEMIAKYGFNPAESLPIGYKTPQQDFDDFARREATKAAINAQYAKEGKPEPYVVVESADGVQQWIRKGEKIPEGFKVSKPSATTINVGGTAKPVPTEKTRLLTISESGKKGVDDVESILFNEDGSLNRGVVAALNAPFGTAASGALGQAASQAYNQIIGAIRDKLRLESGAVIGEEEMAREMQRYLPGIFDTPEVARKKLDALRDVMDSYQELGGRGVVEQGKDKVARPEGVDLVFNPVTGDFE